MTKLMVKKILEHAASFPWSLQGLGMLRLYLSDDVRMHVWDPLVAFPNASPLHTHPWDFTSVVVAGVVKNIRYVEGSGDRFHFSCLRCGPGGALAGERQDCFLKQQAPEIYYEGDAYWESAEEIHESQPARGSVTIVKRIFKADRDHARVFWREGTEWGSAEPRPATTAEVLAVTKNALELWF